MSFPLRVVRTTQVARPNARVSLVSHAAYHLDELIPIVSELAHRGVQSSLYLVEANPVLRRLRSQHRRFKRSVEVLKRRGIELGPSVQSSDIDAFDGLVVMNDWGPCRELVETARHRGVPSFGKVEGVQDFDDTSTGQSRNAYREVDVILCQGANDFHALSGARRVIVGNCRLERIVQQSPPSRRQMPVVINSNFSYGQQTEHRRAWIRMATDGCSAAAKDAIISRHPADRGLLPPWKVARAPIEQLLPGAPALITRFSSVGFEALCLGVPIAYLNPHGEHAGPFANPAAAFEHATTSEELGEILRRESRCPEAVRSAALPFIRTQIDMTDQPSEHRAADAIVSELP